MIKIYNYILTYDIVTYYDMLGVKRTRRTSEPSEEGDTEPKRLRM